MQLPFFFRKHYSAFSIQCIPMLFHNTIYFIYNKQRDLEQTYPSPNTQHTNRKRSSECRNSETEVKSNQRQKKYQANYKQRESQKSSEQIASNNIGRNYWPSIIPVKYLKLRCLHTVQKCFSFIITSIFICILSHLLGQSDKIPKIDNLCQDLELLNQTVF